MKKLMCLLLATMLLLGGCGQREKPFRLHIMANSNAPADQQVKLKVRDAVLEVTAKEMKNCSSREEAEAYMQSHLGQLVQTADRVLKQEGMDYTASAEIGTFQFPEKTYGDVTYPAGEYRALRIHLGKGEGDNWWCVMFPPLCIVNTQELPEDEEVVVDSLLLEWLRGLFGE
ncbi:MAG: stage II sporulation protein R [Christensenellaceae bacterium]|nr:stage II sporulation protein R [Christensenellaceae bacterium]